MDYGDLERELAWFAQVVQFRFERYFGADHEQLPGTDTAVALTGLPPPDLSAATSPWAQFVNGRALALPERLALVLALVPQLRPRLLDVFFTKNLTFDRRFTEFGARVVDDALEPTGETLAFLLDGGSLSALATAARVLDPEHALARADVLRAVPQRADQPLVKAPLRVSPEYLSLFMTGQRPRPVLGMDFPAQTIGTALDWSDLILHPGTRKQLHEIETFIAHGATLLRDWGMASRVRPGYRALFYGPPGTGKTLSAALLGKRSGLDVYRVDLSLIVSKYIGETEKNLARVFDRVQQTSAILFFDEADALFGKRSDVKDSHDRYANQQLAYLLQRIETFDGVAILASNLRDNIDDAFMRRFEACVYFPLPRAEERRELWARGFSPQAELDASVDLAELAHQHELSGAAIVNVIRRVSLAAISEGQRAITREDLLVAIRRELDKG
jgi:hypothetical protein